MLRQVYKAKRELFARLYPTTLVYKDGSTVTVRHPEPRQIIKIPLTIEDCIDGKSKVAWKNRRRIIVAGSVTADRDDVTFDARKYLRPRKK